MVKRIIALISLAALLFLSSCASNDPKDRSTPKYSFTDDTGNKVELPKIPDKVAVLFSSYAEIWQLAGGSVDITVAETIERGFADKEALLVDDNSGHTSINTELLIASHPDLVIGTADHEIQCDVAQLLRERGIPVALFKVECLDDYLRVLKIFTDILGTPEIYENNGVYVKEKTDRLLCEANKNKEEKNILFLRSGSSERSTKAKTAKDNFVCAMLDELGCCNIADNAEILLDSLSLEEILLCDPDVIFISTMGDSDAATEYINDLFTEEGWKELTAVKEGNYHFLPKDMFHYKPNARWYDAYRYLADILY